MKMNSHYSGLYSRQIAQHMHSLHLDAQQLHQAAAVVPLETTRREAGGQRENTDEDELDLYDVLVRGSWGHVATYESVMNLLHVCVCERIVPV